MKILRHPDEVLAFFQNYSDSCVTALIQQRMEELTDADTSMEELVAFVILESGDGIEQLQTQMEMQVLTEQGAPLWEVIEEHATCYELVFVLSSSGYGTLVIASKLVCEPDILALCQKHAYGKPLPDPAPDPIDATVAKNTAHRGGFFTSVHSKEL